jgi:endonuclease/exonuclease/phosphatase family metal-dependent hydrolase
VLLCGCGDDAVGLDSGLDAPPAVDSGPGVDAAPRVPVTISIATWNAHNFFDEVNDPDTLDDVPSAAEVERKIDQVGAVLAAIDADVVILQEVENRPLLERLCSGPLDGMGYVAHELRDAFDPRSIDIGVLSRRVPVTVVSHQGEQFRAPGSSRDYYFARDALEVFIDLDGLELIVTGLHLRSQLDGGDEHRLAEATHVHDIVTRRIESGSTRIVVGGDLNDFPDSPPLLALTGDGSLEDLAARLPVGERWTTTFRDMPRQFDYLLGTAAVSTAVQEIEVVRGPEVDLASDHAPVRVVLEL